jgi:hypothetical protein
MLNYVFDFVSDLAFDLPPSGLPMSGEYFRVVSLACLSPQGEFARLLEYSQ